MIVGFKIFWHSGRDYLQQLYDLKHLNLNLQAHIGLMNKRKIFDSLETKPDIAFRTSIHLNYDSDFWAKTKSSLSKFVICDLLIEIVVFT